MDQDDELLRRAETLVNILSDSRQWQRWAVERPERFAALLGVCADGEIAIATKFVPALELMRLQWMGNVKARSEQEWRQAMVDEVNRENGDREDQEDKNGSDSWKKDAAEAGKEAIDLLRVGLKEKKKKDKLAALVTAWEDCASYKDLLIQLYENDRVIEEKKEKAKLLRGKLEETQGLLREIRRKVEADEDPSEQATRTQDLLREIIRDLVLF